MFYVIVMIAHKEIIYKIEEKGNEKEMKACQYKKNQWNTKEGGNRRKAGQKDKI